MNNFLCRLLIAVLIALGGVRLTTAAEKLDWEPGKTMVFVVGVLEWEHANVWPSFPAAMKDRRDEQLVKYFRTAGVPNGRIKYLQDRQATKKRIEAEFKSLLDDSTGVDLLVFYYCGHGSRNIKSGETRFANYDAGGNNSSAWNVRDVFSTIEKRFQGKRVLLLADCCHSGALYDEAQRLGDSKIAYAALTSSYSHNTSTGNWTFSDSLLAGLRGEQLVDLDGDHSIELDEIARYTELELAFIEGQKSMFSAGARFSGRSRLATTTGAASPRIGQRIEVSYKDKWYRAKSIAADADRLEIHYVGYDDSWNEWVGSDRVRPFQPKQFGEGDKVDVQWKVDKHWYAARVLKAWQGLHLVHYDGYDVTWDEWVSGEAIRKRAK